MRESLANRPKRARRLNTIPSPLSDLLSHAPIGRVSPLSNPAMPGMGRQSALAQYLTVGGNSSAVADDTFRVRSPALSPRVLKPLGGERNEQDFFRRTANVVPDKKSSRRRDVVRALWRLITGLILLILVVVVAFQNRRPIHIHVLWWTLPHVPLALVVLIAILLGALMGMAAVAWAFIRRRRWSTTGGANSPSPVVSESAGVSPPVSSLDPAPVGSRNGMTHEPDHPTTENPPIDP